MPKIIHNTKNYLYNIYGTKSTYTFNLVCALINAKFRIDIIRTLVFKKTSLLL